MKCKKTLLLIASRNQRQQRLKLLSIPTCKVYKKTIRKIINIQARIAFKINNFMFLLWYSPFHFSKQQRIPCSNQVLSSKPSCKWPNKSSLKNQNHFQSSFELLRYYLLFIKYTYTFNTSFYFTQVSSTQFFLDSLNFFGCLFAFFGRPFPSLQ